MTYCGLGSAPWAFQKCASRWSLVSLEINLSFEEGLIRTDLYRNGQGTDVGHHRRRWGPTSSQSSVIAATCLANSRLLSSAPPGSHTSMMVSHLTPVNSTHISHRVPGSVNAIIFMAPVGQFDQFLEEDATINCLVSPARSRPLDTEPQLTRASYRADIERLARAVGVDRL
jgi:hypothetical protein